MPVPAAPLLRVPSPHAANTGTGSANHGIKGDRMPHLQRIAALCAPALLAGCAVLGPAPDPAALGREVADTERAFAATMARRDFAGFQGFLADDAIFFSGGQATRGKAQVAQQWQPLYQPPQPPFSWEPEQVQVLDSGSLALSTGPVRDAQGKRIGTFNSIWRREAPGVWRIVFDKGSPVCN
jgi:ketosteroid isomerase-like protein